MKKLKQQPALYYKLAFNAGLQLSGVECGAPQFVGNQKAFSEFFDGLIEHGFAEKTQDDYREYINQEVRFLNSR